MHVSVLVICVFILQRVCTYLYYAKVGSEFVKPMDWAGNLSLSGELGWVELLYAIIL